MIKEIIFLDDKDTWCITDDENNKDTWRKFLLNIVLFIKELSHDDASICQYDEIKLCSFFQVKNETLNGEQWEDRVGIYKSISGLFDQPELDYNVNRNQRLLGWLRGEINALEDGDETDILIFCDFSWECFSDEDGHDIRNQIWDTLKTKNNCLLFYYTTVDVEGALGFIKAKLDEKENRSCRLGDRLWTVPRNPTENMNDFIVAIANLYNTFCESKIHFKRG